MNIPHNDAEYRRAPAGIKARKLKKGFSSYEVLSNCLSAGEPYIAYGVTPYIGRVPLSTKCSQMTFHGRFRQACFSHDFAPSRSSFCLNPKGSYELSNSLLVGQPLHFCAYASFAWFLNDLVRIVAFAIFPALCGFLTASAAHGGECFAFTTRGFPGALELA
ncbi:hypothetical protein FRC0411_01463 [Corynebacterium diphtheriae]|nr:hypothetical protein FRC0411_01463 [Corynebacterium diphtheriae]CAB0997323.1 hypothetical protein FRC0492_01408 [Corynebacterium diphtheriae]CAB1017238.1 hypothetical protein FRC0524_01406 [Corynebacterium diphtheriae]